MLGKASEKQTRTIKDKGGKQVKAIEEHGKQLLKSNAFIKEYDYDTKKDSRSLLKLKEIFNKLIDEKRDIILKLNKKINFDDLMYNFKDKCMSKFNDFDNAITF